MKKLLIFSMFSLALFANEVKEEVSKELTIEEKEQASVIMLQMQSLQLQQMQLKQQIDQKNKEYTDFLMIIQNKYDKKGCKLQLDKKWNCPKE